MSALHQEAIGALKRIETKNKGLSTELDKAAGYAVFPKVGRAGAVLGGAYGHGVVFVRGDPIGEATLGQVTLGVQVGGQTFTELVIFHSREALERFKLGRIAFDANASAAMVKGASGTTDYEKDVTARAYSEGGMLLETSIGVQSFSFKSKGSLETPEAGEQSSSGKK